MGGILLFPPSIETCPPLSVCLFSSALPNSFPKCGFVMCRKLKAVGEPVLFLFYIVYIPLFSGSLFTTFQSLGTRAVLFGT